MLVKSSKVSINMETILRNGVSVASPLLRIVIQYLTQKTD